MNFPFTEEEINRAHQYFANWARLNRPKRKSDKKHDFEAKDRFKVKGVPFMIWWREEDGIIEGRVSIASYTDDPIYQPTLGKMRVTLRDNGDSSLDYEPIDYDEIVDEWNGITNMIRRD